MHSKPAVLTAAVRFCPREIQKSWRHHDCISIRYVRTGAATNMYHLVFASLARFPGKGHAIDPYLYGHMHRLPRLGEVASSSGLLRTRKRAKHKCTTLVSPHKRTISALIFDTWYKKYFTQGQSDIPSTVYISWRDRTRPDAVNVAPVLPVPSKAAGV